MEHRHIQRDGFYNFVVHGRAYHYISAVFPNNDENAIRQFGQLYVVDSETATDERHQQHQNLNRSLLLQLDRIIREINPFAEIYGQINRFVDENNTDNFNLIIFNKRQQVKFACSQ